MSLAAILKSAAKILARENRLVDASNDDSSCADVEEVESVADVSTLARAQ